MQEYISIRLLRKGSREEILSFPILPVDTFLQLKHRIEAHTGIPVARLRIVLGTDDEILTKDKAINLPLLPVEVLPSASEEMDKLMKELNDTLTAIRQVSANPHLNQDVLEKIAPENLAFLQNSLKQLSSEKSYTPKLF